MATEQTGGDGDAAPPPPRPPRRYIAATAGHIDHGKSALVERLTGTDPDRLAEEKRRGITIELGYADLSLECGAARVGLVDVPGHEDFVKNMVTGVGQVDVAMLVVAADDGWMPQTEEHLQILEYLGARSGVLILTKADLVADAAARLGEISARAQGSIFENAPHVAVSAVTGAGIDHLRQALCSVLHSLSPRADQGKPRLAVDRAFTVAGAGTVVTGTLVGGRFCSGDDVVIHPKEAPARIRAIQTFNSEVTEAPPGSRVALNLATVRAGRGGRDRPRGGTVQRGYVVVGRQLHMTPSRAIDVLIRRSPRLEPRAKPLQGVLRVRLHIGTRHLGARLALSEPVAAGGSAVARLQPEEPLATLVGDRLVIRDWSQRLTLGGGTVLDPCPPGAAAATRQAAYLRLAVGDDGRPGFALRNGSERARGALQVLAERDGLVTLGEVDRLLPEATQELQEAARALVAEGILVGGEDGLVEAGRLAGLTGDARETLASWVADHPERGAAPGSLLASLVAALPQPASLVALIERQLRRDGYQIEGGQIRPPGTTAALPEPLRPLLREMRAALTATPLTPPSRKQLTASTDQARVLEYLVASGEALLLGADVVVTEAAFAVARERIVEHLSQHGEATASELRVALDTNRRVIIPLLEHLDREGITVRHGDRRRLSSR